MRVVSWNLGAAFGPYVERHNQAWHWLAAIDPDLALLQECIPPDWARSRWDVEILPFQYWGSAIVARADLRMRPLALEPTTLLGRFGSYLATADVSIGDQELLVASVHTRAAEAPAWVTGEADRSAIARPTVGTPWSNDVAFAGYRGLAEGRRFLIGGDWNTARYEDESGSGPEDGAAFFRRASDSGWTEVSLDAEGKEGRTWYGPGGARPYQPDHMFCDPQTAAATNSFAIDPYPTVALALSDHAPLVLDLHDRPAEVKDA